MARRNYSGTRGPKSRLPSARVEWLEVADQGADVEVNLTSASPEPIGVLAYDFSSANKYADNYGGGDWTTERLLGGFAVMSDGARAAQALVKVCFGIGMVMGRTSIGVSTSGADLASVVDGVQFSWMVRMCCYINVGEAIIERCEFDIKAKRKIAPEARIFVVAGCTPLLANETLVVRYDYRMLVRQRGSRL